MKKVILSFFLPLIVGIEHNDITQYDYFIVAMQWQPALCRNNNGKCVKQPISSFLVSWNLAFKLYKPSATSMLQP